MLDRVKVWRIRGPICDSYTSFLELFLDFFGCMDWGIILYEYKVVSIVWYNEILKKGEIRVSSIPMLL